MKLDAFKSWSLRDTQDVFVFDIFFAGMVLNLVDVGHLAARFVEGQYGSSEVAGLCVSDPFYSLSLYH